MSKTSIWWVLYFPSKSNALISTLWANITFNMFGACSSSKENSKAKVFTTHSVNSLLPWWIWRKTILNYHESHESWLWSIFFHHLNLQVMEDWTQSLTTIYFHLLHEVHKFIASSPTPGFARAFLPPVCDAAEFLEASMIPSLSIAHRGTAERWGGNQCSKPTGSCISCITSCVRKLLSPGSEHQDLYGTWVLQVQKLKCRESRCLKYGTASS